MATPSIVIDEPMSRAPGVRSQAHPEPLTMKHLASVAPAYETATQCVQFVVSPGKTGELQRTLPARIDEAFHQVPAFAGCLVMISDQEARLVTVVTFWTGKQRIRLCNENSDDLKQVLSPYVDHWLRSESQLAYCSLISPVNRRLPGA